MTTLSLETVQWASLPDIDSVEPLNHDDFAVLEEIHRVLLRHGKSSRFGVCLLHKHFEVADDEVAIEYTDVEQRESRVVVEKKTDFNMNSIQTLWRFQMDGSNMATRCDQRCAPGGTTHRIIHTKVPT
jgi:hypothetical protein